jgi:hypothetical protein
MFIAVTLIALALGYRVMVDASKEKEGLKTLGQIIGALVIVMATLTLLCGVMRFAAEGRCPMMPKFGCPITAKS